MIAIDITKALRAAGKVQRTANATVIDMRTAPLKESAFLTFKAILRIFKMAAATGNVMQPVEGVSAIRASNGDIADFRRCHPRTIQRHREALLDAGLIMREVFHGSHHPFEIWVPDHFLGISEAIERHEARQAVAALLKAHELLDAAASQEPQPPSAKSGEDKLSLFNSIRDHINIPNADVEEGRGDVTRPEGRAVAGRFDGAQEAGGGAALRRERHPGGAPRGDRGGGLDTDRAGVLKGLASILWMNARNALWPSMVFNDEREAQILKSIQKLYAAVPFDRIEKAHEQFGEMVAMARDYLERSPTPAASHEMATGEARKGVASGKGPERTRFVAVPWKWFDPDTAHGIMGILPWWEKRDRARERGKGEYELYKAISAWEANERKPPSRQIERTAIYNILKMGLAKLGKETLLDQFDFAVNTSISLRNSNGKATKKAGA